MSAEVSDAGGAIAERIAPSTAEWRNTLRAIPPDGLLAGIGLASTAQAETCAISFTVIKAGFVVGGQGGSGSMRCGNRSYRISIGGLSYGFMIGASETRFRGTATFNGSPRNVAGVYGAGGAKAVVLANQNGAVLALTGYQRGLQINADLSGHALTMR